MDRFCYAGKCPGCGHVIALTLDSPEYRKDVAKDVAEWIRDGLIVERMKSKDGRQLFDNCACNQQPQTETMPLFGQEHTS